METYLSENKTQNLLVSTIYSMWAYKLVNVLTENETGEASVEEIEMMPLEETQLESDCEMTPAVAHRLKLELLVRKVVRKKEMKNKDGE